MSVPRGELAERAALPGPSATAARQQARLSRSTWLSRPITWAGRYWSLTKGLQTSLLLLTGLAGFLSTRGPWTSAEAALVLSGSLMLAISGSTMLNMAFDRDIDACMRRTARRPLPSGNVSSREAWSVGAVLCALGVGWGLFIVPLYGAIVFAGFFFDVVVYTLWLKRRTAYSIVIGGLAGAMPALAGRVLAVGRIDLTGILLALGVLAWIPTHILTFSLRHEADYEAAGVPTFPSRYGAGFTRLAIAASSLVAGLAMIGAALLAGTSPALLRLLLLLNAGLVGLAVASLARPSQKMNFALFKCASLYMLASMLIVAL